MTAEIAILNKEAVALAADSALSSGSDQLKVYNSANKIFCLSCYNPLGIMVYGDASFLDVPWETIIKSYRAQLMDKTFDYISEYADNFIEYLENHSQLFSEADEVEFFKQFLDNRLKALREKMTKNLYLRSQKADKLLGEPDISEVIRETIEGELSRWTKIEPLVGFQEDFVLDCIKGYRPLIEQTTEKHYAKFDQTAKDKILSLAELMLARISFDQSDLAFASGLVIAGFGEKQYFPALKSFTIEGKIKKRVRKVVQHDILMGPKNRSVIIPFAQHEMVDVFVEGISPEIKGSINKGINYLCNAFQNRLPEKIVSVIKVTDEEKASIISLISNLKEELGETCFKMINASIQRNIRPIVEAIPILPKDELASLAESLVHLTSLKRRVTMVPETVGGPIDVAIISKGDGLIWMKRKHYFKPELNADYFAQRYREKKDVR